MSEDNEMSGVQGEPQSAEDRLRDLGMQLKQHIEYKEWEALAGLLAIPSVWVMDRNMPVGDAIGRMRALLDPAADIQLTLDRVTRTNIGADDANVSLVARLLWSEGETWAEHEESVEMHLGFTRGDEDWAFASLGFTAPNVPQPEPAQASEAPQASQANDVEAEGRYFDVANFARQILTKNWGASTYRFWDNVPGLTSEYFAAQEGFAAPPVQARPSHAIVYMPVFVPVDILDPHLPK